DETVVDVVVSYDDVRGRVLEQDAVDCVGTYVPRADHVRVGSRAVAVDDAALRKPERSVAHDGDSRVRSRNLRTQIEYLVGAAGPCKRRREHRSGEDAADRQTHRRQDPSW